MKYNLDLATKCLFGLANAASGQYYLSEEKIENTIKALYISLSATTNLNKSDIYAVKRLIMESENNKDYYIYILNLFSEHPMRRQ